MLMRFDPFRELDRLTQRGWNGAASVMPLDAYRRGAMAHGLALPPAGETKYLVDCFRLHKVLKSLSESGEKKFPAGTVAKLVGMAEQLGRLLL